MILLNKIQCIQLPLEITKFVILCHGLHDEDQRKKGSQLCQSQEHVLVVNKIFQLFISHGALSILNVM